MTLSPWLRFFRFPNLPTVPGDALAGGALALPFNWFFAEQIWHFYGAALVVLFAYMFGLADNDVAGAKSDATDAPERPIPAGEITLAQARLARTACLLALVLTVYFTKFTYAYPLILALLVCIVIYNRFKGFVLMGLCRGLGFLIGVLAVAGDLHTFSDLVSRRPAYVIAFLAWTLHTAAITWLASDEHKAEKSMGVFRFIPGMATLLPIIAVATIDVEFRIVSTVVIIFNLLAYAAWFRTVWRLGKPHTPEIRRRAVGGAIGALMFMQAGFVAICAFGGGWILSVAVVFVFLFLARLSIRHFQPRITGS